MGSVYLSEEDRRFIILCLEDNRFYDKGRELEKLFREHKYILLKDK